MEKLMRTEATQNASIQKLIHIAGVSLVMVLTLCAAVAVSGNPMRDSSPRPSFVPQSTSPSQATAPTACGLASSQPELLHDAPTVELKSEPAHRRMVKMLVTAYCPCTKCCGPNANGITANGNYVTYNDGHFVAADSSLPFGTKVIIPGYNATPVEVIDRGGAIKGDHIDVFFPTHEQALQWGRRTIEVTILDW